MPDRTYEYDHTCPDCGSSGQDIGGMGRLGDEDRYCSECDLSYRTRIIYEEESDAC